MKPNLDGKEKDKTYSSYLPNDKQSTKKIKNSIKIRE